MRRIFSQGDFDGACFLYSIVNACAALRRETPEFSAVCRAFAQVDFPGDFLNGTVGTTGAYEGKHELLRENIARALALMGGAGFQVKRIPGPFQPAMLESLLDGHSVVVLRYQGSSRQSDGMDHWVSVVDYDARTHDLHVACSVRMQKACNEDCGAYAEFHHPRHDRWSNDALTDACGYSVVEGEVFQVSLKASAA